MDNENLCDKPKNNTGIRSLTTYLRMTSSQSKYTNRVKSKSETKRFEDVFGKLSKYRETVLSELTHSCRTSQHGIPTGDLVRMYDRATSTRMCPVKLLRLGPMSNTHSTIHFEDLFITINPCPNGLNKLSECKSDGSYLQMIFFMVHAYTSADYCKFSATIPQ